MTDPTNALTGPIVIGDTVRADLPGSWTHNREFTVLALDVTSSDGIRGHLLQAPEGVTVVELGCLILVQKGSTP